MAFRKDYENSRKKELEAEEKLKQLGCLTENTGDKGVFSDYDISTTSTTTGYISTFEVKFNSNLDNICFIETARIINGTRTPSGLSSTKADHHILTFAGDLNHYLIPTITIKLLIDLKRYMKLVVDKNGYELAIFNREYLLKHCTKL